ncbi:MAG: hypothetical protein GF421_00500 [Candidatus Aminicenantes bacterium]|nr:hypothetical protein [Candidatus Aminicenantes bacterium]
MIPVWMKVKVKEKGKRAVCLPLPLFLIWIIVFALLIAVLPLILAAVILAFPFGYSKTILYSYIMIYALIFSLSGLRVDVDTKEQDKTVYIKII